jgi:predicted ABC-type ATPase
VPEAGVRRRWVRSLVNFPLGARRADLWRVFDDRQRSRPVAEGDGRADIFDAEALGMAPSRLVADIRALAAQSS